MRDRLSEALRCDGTDTKDQRASGGGLFHDSPYVILDRRVLRLSAILSRDERALPLGER
jgi:hypothetical protein